MYFSSHFSSLSFSSRFLDSSKVLATRSPPRILVRALLPSISRSLFTISAVSPSSNTHVYPSVHDCAIPAQFFQPRSTQYSAKPVAPRATSRVNGLRNAWSKSFTPQICRLFASVSTPKFSGCASPMEMTSGTSSPRTNCAFSQWRFWKNRPAAPRKNTKGVPSTSFIILTPTSAAPSAEARAAGQFSSWKARRSRWRGSRKHGGGPRR
mmetsp:Transcript_628/g.1835  ORF Transcript_628/g.1835 Transcript_628/m.1835 type:complete len:209 (-) Transcript_628:274-900(-)